MELSWYLAWASFARTTLENANVQEVLLKGKVAHVHSTCPRERRVHGKTHLVCNLGRESHAINRDSVWGRVGDYCVQCLQDAAFLHDDVGAVNVHPSLEHWEVTVVRRVALQMHSVAMLPEVWEVHVDEHTCLVAFELGAVPCADEPIHDRGDTSKPLPDAASSP